MEIDKLNAELERLKKMIEKNNNLYESMLDKTTQSLERLFQIQNRYEYNKWIKKG